MKTWLSFTLIGIGFVQFLICAFISIRLEQTVGYYECKHCGEKFVPTFAQINYAPHMGRTRQKTNYIFSYADGFYSEKLIEITVRKLPVSPLRRRPILPGKMQRMRKLPFDSILNAATAPSEFRLHAIQNCFSHFTVDESNCKDDNDDIDSTNL